MLTQQLVSSLSVDTAPQQEQAPVMDPLALDALEAIEFGLNNPDLLLASLFPSRGGVDEEEEFSHHSHPTVLTEEVTEASSQQARDLMASLPTSSRQAATAEALAQLNFELSELPEDVRMQITHEAVTLANHYAYTDRGPVIADEGALTDSDSFPAAGGGVFSDREAGYTITFAGFVTANHPEATIAPPMPSAFAPEYYDITLEGEQLPLDAIATDTTPLVEEPTADLLEPEYHAARLDKQTMWQSAETRPEDLIEAANTPTGEEASRNIVWLEQYRNEQQLHAA